MARRTAEKELQFEGEDLDEGLKDANVLSYFERTSPMLLANEKKAAAIAAAGDGLSGSPGSSTDDIISPAMLPQPKANLGEKIPE